MVNVASRATEIKEGAFCPVVPAAAVRIYQLRREFDYWTWLCAAARAARVKLGWQVGENHAPPFGDLTCDDHTRAGLVCP